MKHIILPAGLVFSLVLSALGQAPVAKKIPVIFEEFGNKRVDEYYWMKDKKDPAVLEYINQENAYSAAMLQPFAALQEELFREMTSRQAKSLSSLPAKRNGYWYYNKTSEGQSYPVYYRRKESMGAAEELVQDANLLAGDSKVLFFQEPVVSPNNRFAIVSFNTKGDRRYLVKIKDLTTGTFLSDSIDEKSFIPAVWANDNAHIFYIAINKAVRPYKLMLHKVGSPFAEDNEVWQEKESTFRLIMTTSKDRKYLFLQSRSPLSSEALYIPLSDPYQKPMSISPRQAGLDYRVIDHVNGTFYIRTNYKAPNFRIVKTSIENSDKDLWTDVIAESKRTFLESQVEILKDKIVTAQKSDGITNINVQDVNNGRSSNIQFPEKAYWVNFSVPDDDVNNSVIRLNLTSYATPPIDYSYNLTTGEKAFLRQEGVENFRSGDYQTSVVQVPVRDGESVPINLVFNKKAFRADGKHPLLLETYSWYGYDTPPFFDSSLISLLDRGFAYAYVNARGGSAKGPSWWAAGRRSNRNKTFFDVVDVAQWLVDNKYVSKKKLMAIGSSAGGTNIGAIVNLRPDLFKAVIADVPWLDVVTDMKNPEIPGVASEYEEEGDPNIEAEYRYMLTWSPYDNIKKANYPAILATSGLFDTNVPFYHALKWVAKIRQNNSGRAPILMMCNTSAGHFGNTDRVERLKTTAFKYAFLVSQLK